MNPNEEEDEEWLEKEDRISELPDHIIHDILRFLSIRSAAQTKILSHRWKNVFSSIPDLDFTTLTDSPLSNRPTLMRYQMGSRYQIEPPTHIRDVNFINSVFSLRDNNYSIRTLKLKSFQLTSTAFNCLIKCPKINDIEELDVNMKHADYFNIPWSIINCNSLKVLSLNIMYRRIKRNLNLIQPMNGEFKFLNKMILCNVPFLILFHNKSDIFTDSSFPNLKELTLISCRRMKELTLRCSGLKDLVIKNCFFLNKLDIYGLKLEKLKVENCFPNINNSNNVKIIAPIIKVLKWVVIPSIQSPKVLEISDVLEKAVIGIYSPQPSEYIIKPEEKRNLSNMIIALSRAKFLKLKYLSIQLNGDRDGDGDGDGDHDDQVLKSNSFLNHLRTVKLVGLLEYDEDIDFAKFLINNGKVLEEMVVCFGKHSKISLARQGMIKSMIMQCSPASFKARILFH
ncbi:putative F-box/FBD/LRR-repeat protein At4g03220 [Impatiens glandulifera]|uniref:putative F-box/FBD/LRR-repeat protein At4g03220 n=1 Tax=Impatiens glandulifera TaxID=253017 RepID=UPI001FB1573B|nr:putative F-box/FBD/LRR-repeat protein At4g03220 [Impatiens glandulifera]